MHSPTEEEIRADEREAKRARGKSLIDGWRSGPMTDLPNPADTMILNTLAKYFRRAWALVQSKDGKWAVIDNYNGMSILTEWHPEFRAAIMDAEVKLQRGVIVLEEEQR